MNLLHYHVLSTDWIISNMGVSIHRRRWDAMLSDQRHSSNLASSSKRSWLGDRIRQASNELRAIAHLYLEDSVEASFGDLAE